MVEKGVLDSLHDRFAAMDEDGSGALTAEDLKQQPLGLKASVAASAVKKCRAAWTHESNAIMVHCVSVLEIRTPVSSECEHFQSL
jgi:Ca2+-binding EF-hand superfamily protein